MEPILDDQLYFEADSLDDQTIKRINLIKIEINDHIQKILSGRNVFYVLAAISLVAAYFSYSNVDNINVTTTDVLVEAGILVAVYLCCGLFLRKKPMTMLLIGLGLYVLLMVIYATVDLSTIYKGYLVKIFVFFYLGRALVSTRQLKKEVEKLKAIGVSPDELDLIKNLDTVPKTRKSQHSIPIDKKDGSGFTLNIDPPKNN